MRRVLVLLMALIFTVGSMMTVFGGPGPAPSSGDGDPDGSGFDAPPGPLGDGDPFGPAPSSGDGEDDGSGLEPPNGPS
jgi:hypothetical protein